MDSLKWGVTVTPLKKIDLQKGSVLHALKSSDVGFVGFGEAYFSCVSPLAIKGWKRHSLMTLNLVVPVGSVKFFIFKADLPLVDIEGLEAPIAITLGKERYARLTIPPGLWVAFQGLDRESNMLLNVANIEHDPDEAENIDLDAFGLDLDSIQEV